MAKKPRKRGRPANDKACIVRSFYLPEDIDRRLSEAVAVGKGNRSKVVADLLDKHLPNGRKPGRKK